MNAPIKSCWEAVLVDKQPFLCFAHRGGGVTGHSEVHMFIFGWEAPPLQIGGVMQESPISMNVLLDPSVGGCLVAMGPVLTFRRLSVLSPT